jgi:FAD/FMN-containing dehydrogenase
LDDAHPSDYRGVLRTDLLARELYSEGAGIARSVPLAVAVPADVESVGALTRWARSNGFSLMPRGSASGMAAGAIGSGISLDLSRMTAIGDVDTSRRRIRVGPGAIRADVDAAARAVGLRFPVDPSSGSFCTIGGMTGTNAAGARTLRFGAMRPWVTGIECVFDDGSIAWIRRGEPLPLHIPAVARLHATLELVRANAPYSELLHTGVRKESSGYAISTALLPEGSLVDLLVGSEGTLAVFTQIELALIPVASATGSILASFNSLEAATECAVLASGLGASACELLDKTFLDVAASKNATGVPTGAEAVLLVEVEADDADSAAQLIATISERFRRLGASDVAVGLTKEAQHQLWDTSPCGESDSFEPRATIAFDAVHRRRMCAA